jgi:hypothetical protein
MPGHYLKRVGPGVSIVLKKDYRLLVAQPLVGFGGADKGGFVNGWNTVTGRAAGHYLGQGHAPLAEIGLPAKGGDVGRSQLLL